jgi:hypothetical protein
VGKRKKRNHVQERIAKDDEERARARLIWRLKKVYGRSGATPPEGPSQSVWAMPTAFESNRHRH